MRSSGRGVGASAAASPQRRGGPGIVAADGASPTRNDALECGASGGASLWRNGGVVVLHPDDFGRCPLDMDFVGRDGLVAAATVDVGEEQSGTSVYGEGCAGSVAAALAASYKEGGLDGWGPGKVEGVKTGVAVGEGEVSGLSAVLVGQASTGGSGTSAASVAL